MNDNDDKVHKRKQDLLVESENTIRMEHLSILAVISFFLNIKFEMFNISHPNENND